MVSTIDKFFKMSDSAKIFKALGDDVRLSIVLFLKDGERCACEIPKAVGRAQPTVSQHLRILRDAGVLKSRRDGKKIMYRVCCPEILKLIEYSSSMPRK